LSGAVGLVARRNCTRAAHAYKFVPLGCFWSLLSSRDQKDGSKNEENNTYLQIPINVPYRNSKSQTVLSNRKKQVSPSASCSSAQVVDAAIRDYELSWEMKKKVSFFR
jgi:hypothetical protein